MAGTLAGLAILVLSNCVLSNSQDQVTTTQSPRLWKGIISTLSPLLTNENHVDPTENSAARITDDFTSMAPNHQTTMIADDNTRNQEATGTMTSEGSMSTVPETTVSTTTIKTFERGRTSCTAYIFAMLGVMPVLVCAAGLLGNAVCIVVFWGDRNKSATHTLLLQVAVCDTAVLITWPVMLMSQVVYFYSDHSDQNFLNAFPYMRKYGWGIANVAQMVACWLIVVITAQRYIAVCHPHKMRFLGKPRVAWIIFAIILAICIPFNLMRWLEYDVVVKDGKTVMTFSSIGANASYQIYFKGVAYYFLIFIAPVTLLLFFTVALILQLRQSKMKVTAQAQPSTNPATASTDAKPKKGKQQTSTDEITFALIVVDIVFIICQTFNPLRRLLDFLEIDYRSCWSAYSYFRPLTGMFIVFNSAINFVVFCLCAKGFRSQVFERVCGKLKKGGNESVNSVSTKQTTAGGALSSKM